MTPEQRREYERFRRTAEVIARRWDHEYMVQGLPLPAYVLYRIGTVVWKITLPMWGIIALFRGVIFN
jgi:hypothetical protein